VIVVIDTNVVLSMFKRGHPSRPIFDAWTGGRLRWAMSTEILLEYEETAARMTHPAYIALVFQTMGGVEAVRQNIHRVSPSFRFNLITADPDDNKFADCAIAAEADFIITADQHFEVMRGSGYKPQPVTPEEFIRLHL
jgi:putative PIN family toxin of toxin-antitoxin system